MIARLMDWISTFTDGGRHDQVVIAPHASRYAPWDDPSRGGWRDVTR